MARTSSSQAIPEEVARQFCGEIRGESDGKRYSFSGMLCGICSRCSRGDEAQMLFNCMPGLRGCTLVNARYDRMLARQASAC
jgi:hypothetical protein